MTSTTEPATPSTIGSPNGRRLYVRWIKATGLGWLLGIPCIAGLALIAELLGIGGAQVMVGAGMGVGVGFMQGRTLRGILPRAAPWFWSCVGGLAIPFLVADIARIAEWNLGYSVYWAVAVAGLTAGVWQAVILGKRFRSAHWWIPVSALGWTLAGALVGGSDAMVRNASVRGVAGLLAYLGLLAVGGFVLGAVTGVWLARAVPREGVLAATVA